MRILLASVCLFALLFSITSACTPDDGIIAQLKRKNIGRETAKNVELELTIEQSPKERPRAGYVEGKLEKRWHEEAFNFEQQDACSESVSLEDVVHPVSLTRSSYVSAATVHRNGTVHARELISAAETCDSTELRFPVRSVRCRVRWTLAEPIGAIRPASASGKEQSFEILSINQTASELIIDLKHRIPHRKQIIEFFLPALIFMGISWLSLALGPMSITRALLIAASFLLLARHFATPHIGMENALGSEISDIAIFKTFSYLFVFVILVELIFVTCFMSLGKGPCRCCPGASGEYDFEPIYEELNDLRKRNSLGGTDYRLKYTERRKGCGCCGFFALSVDIFTMIALAATLICFLVLFFDDDFSFVQAYEKLAKSLPW